MSIKMIEKIGVVEKRICEMNGKKIVVLVGEECLPEGGEVPVLHARNS
jgi:hypothetical protein